LCEGWECT